MSDRNIGTKNESSLHKSLKFYYSGAEGVTEATVGSYVCDGRTSKGELIEVQTGSFGHLREKVKILAKKCKVRIIYPIIAEKHIELYSAKGRLLHRRKSPLKGNAWDLFKVLLHAPELGRTKNLTIELAVIEAVEKRVDDGKGSRWRKGIRISDREMRAWLYSVVLKSPKDYYQFVPFRKKEEFTVRDLEEKTGIPVDLARKTLYVLAKMKLVERIGMRGQAFIYKRK
jgi:hypothetical protein